MEIVLTVQIILILGAMYFVCVVLRRDGDKKAKFSEKEENIRKWCEELHSAIDGNPNQNSDNSLNTPS